MTSPAGQGGAGQSGSGLWRFGVAVGRGVVAAVGIGVLVVASGVRLPWGQQALYGLVLMTVWLGAARVSASARVTVFLVVLSGFASLRYFVWRLRSVAGFVHAGGGDHAVVAAVVVVGLLVAESYFLLGLVLGYFQTLRPLGRAPASLPETVDDWPEVDLLIPTLGEPMEVLKYTILAAVHIDWPPDRLNVYVLDDGRREEVRAFCAEAGVGYMVRETLEHAKAGNLNAALKRLRAPFVAIFDADQVPTRSFLQMTMGWFLRDPRLAVVQTPQHLYSPDPFERNLDQFRVAPSEGELFYGVVQDGNDLWNAAYFCGSCGVLRRAALDEIGGMAVGTLAEDAHTSVRLQTRGWNTAYINLPLAGGLAPERLSGHIRQRRRWARGMVQVLRKESPLFARGLTWAQRLCYLHASVHFLYAVPRLMFLVAPLVLLVFGWNTFPGSWQEICAYATPHLALFYVTSARVQGRHRYSFWSEIYETVLAPSLVMPTLRGLFWLREGRFRVTAKGGRVERSFFDAGIAWPFLALWAANGLGLVCAGLRLAVGRHPAAWAWMAARVPWHPVSAGTIGVNVVWTLFNLLILSVAIGVARESRQRRSSVRVSLAVPAMVVLQDGTKVEGATVDLSSGGALFVASSPVRAGGGEPVTLVLPALGREARLPALVIEAKGGEVRLTFDELTLRDEEVLATALYSRADVWIRSQRPREGDRPLRSLGRLLSLARFGVMGVVREVRRPGRKAGGGIIVLFAAFGLLLWGSCVRAQDNARTTAQPNNESTAASKAGKDAEQSLIVRDLWGTDGKTLGASSPSSVVSFTVPETEVVRTALLRIRYLVDGEESGRELYLSIGLNGVEVARERVVAERGSSVEDQGFGAEGALSVALPVDLVVHRNTVRFQLMAARERACDVTVCGGEVVRLEGGSFVRLTVTPMVVVATAAVATKQGQTGRVSAGVRRGGAEVVRGGKRFRWRAVVGVLRGPWFFCVAALVSCFVLSGMMHRGLERVARARLAGVEGDRSFR